MLQRQPKLWFEENVEKVRSLWLRVVYEQTGAATAATGTTDTVECGAHGSGIDSRAAGPR